jgi:glucuronide carrier protein
MRVASPLTWKNVIGYGLGDVANNFVFSMGSLFLLNYYTDVAGIGAAAAGTLLASVRIGNALTDVVAGRVVDRTSTRWGRCRPFFLWGGLPLLLLSVAVFSVPAGWNVAGKLIYACVTYGLLVTAYSFVNIPYGSLASLMTQVPRERARLSASRTIMAVCTFSFLALVLGPIVGSVTGPALQTRLIQFTLIMAGTGAVLFFLCFKWTREIVERDIERPKLKASVGTLLTNRPLLILCASALCVLVGCFSMNSSAMYFARYVLGNASQFFVIIGITTLLGTLISAPLVPMLVSHAGKKGTFLLGLAIAALGYLAMFLAPVTSKVWIFGTFGVATIGEMMAMTIMWALAADTVEYGEWRTGVRVEGLTYSFYSFARKCGQALGGSMPAFLLAASGYVPNLATQSEAARLSIQQAVAFVPAIAFMLAFVLMLFYPLTDRRFAELVREIGERRSAAA